ncbi:MAG: TonB-dependent receptor plug domain-containing protein, partial [Alphaproteobacteria bacterium]|nr:TonB-dependent receptor plug domain-containing protein [Alphaproteobacteria bacterium]
MIDLKQLLLSGGSATAVIAAVAFSTAQAQPAPAPADIETISSSASRIELQGFETPTPVSVIGLETINRDAKIEIGDEIRELPQIRGGAGINSGSGSRNVAQGDTAVDTISLRGLGTNRNLVLLDGRRLPLSDVNGNVDINILPQSIIQSVDVITGGASAVYGSDAMSGVVNFKTIRSFDGVRMDVQDS